MSLLFVISPFVLQVGDAFHTDFVGVTDQLVGRILEEMDYRNEAAYADEFGALYRSSEVRCLTSSFNYACFE